jgi:uncharacterized membrane protein (DUF2068 family)
MQFFRVLRTVAVYEAAKGVLVLMLGGGLLRLLHKDVRALAEQLINHFHLNPDGHYSRIFIALAGHINDGHLWLFGGLALLYAMVRFVEAYGLWFGRRWAEWFAALSGAIYIPFEISEVLRRPNWLSVVALLVNVAIVAFMVYGIRHQDEIAAQRVR